jgi:hypothetical protein
VTHCASANGFTLRRSYWVVPARSRKIAPMCAAPAAQRAKARMAQTSSAMTMNTASTPTHTPALKMSPMTAQPLRESASGARASGRPEREGTAVIAERVARAMPSEAWPRVATRPVRLRAHVNRERLDPGGSAAARDFIAEFHASHVVRGVHVAFGGEVAE